MPSTRRVGELLLIGMVGESIAPSDCKLSISLVCTFMFCLTFLVCRGTGMWSFLA